jgi:hypothetical protein
MQTQELYIGLKKHAPVLKGVYLDCELDQDRVGTLQTGDFGSLEDKSMYTDTNKRDQPASCEFFAFVLMPFDTSFNDIYTFGIKGAAEEVGITAERLDEQLFSSNMVKKIHDEIDRADLIIADMSGQNSNVFYEVGYADGRNKPIILMVSDKKDIPFDLKQRQLIIYNKSISKLKSELIARLKKVKEQH